MTSRSALKSAKEMKIKLIRARAAAPRTPGRRGVSRTTCLCKRTDPTRGWNNPKTARPASQPHRPTRENLVLSLGFFRSAVLGST